MKSRWVDKDKFLEYKNNLEELLKTFNGDDYKEMYLEGKKRGILKSLKDRDFTNIITRLNLKLPLTNINLEKIEDFYEDLMKDIYSQESLEAEEREEKKDQNKAKIELDQNIADILF
ncbi:MAG: hypothetical protein ACRDA0_12585 [Cetobacterium sp.]|uniref:hypothetical protein n=1 Tax=Cetobacterium sp. TaxID=2071632 RepID=UPI003F2B8785